MKVTETMLTVSFLLEEVIANFIRNITQIELSQCLSEQDNTYRCVSASMCCNLSMINVFVLMQSDSVIVFIV
jgi:hypothetical protein